jgi:hypothetical protein
MKGLRKVGRKFSSAPVRGLDHQPAANSMGIIRPRNSVRRDRKGAYMTDGRPGGGWLVTLRVASGDGADGDGFG